MHQRANFGANRKEYYNNIKKQKHRALQQASVWNRRMGPKIGFLSPTIQAGIKVVGEKAAVQQMAVITQLVACRLPNCSCL